MKSKYFFSVVATGFLFWASTDAHAFRISIRVESCSFSTKTDGRLWGTYVYCKDEEEELNDLTELSESSIPEALKGIDRKVLLEGVNRARESQRMIRRELPEPVHVFKVDRMEHAHACTKNLASLWETYRSTGVKWVELNTTASCSSAFKTLGRKAVAKLEAERNSKRNSHSSESSESESSSSDSDSED